MWKVILASMLLATACIAFGQHRETVPPRGKATIKSKAKPKPTPKSNAKWETYTPCGVFYKDIDDFIGDLDRGWRSVANTKDDQYWYNSDTERCGDDGILKVWIKIVPVRYKAPGGYSLTLYELKCKSDELRMKSTTEYDKDGKVLVSGDVESSWADAVPDSVGAAILKTVCRSP